MTEYKLINDLKSSVLTFLLTFSEFYGINFLSQDMKEQAMDLTDDLLRRLGLGPRTIAIGRHFAAQIEFPSKETEDVTGMISGISVGIHQGEEALLITPGSAFSVALQEIKCFCWSKEAGWLAGVGSTWIKVSKAPELLFLPGEKIKAEDVPLHKIVVETQGLQWVITNYKDYPLGKKYLGYPVSEDSEGWHITDNEVTYIPITSKSLVTVVDMF